MVEAKEGLSPTQIRWERDKKAYLDKLQEADGVVRIAPGILARLLGIGHPTFSRDLLGTGLYEPTEDPKGRRHYLVSGAEFQKLTAFVKARKKVVEEEYQAEN